MNNKILASIIPVITILSGCAMNGLPQGYSKDTPYNVEERVEKIFIGIPVIASMEGSSVRLNKDWMLTAAHNKPILSLLGKDVYYHPKCDIALYRSSDEGFNGSYDTSYGLVYKGDEVFHVGYPIISTIVSHKGNYLGDVITDDGCQYSATTAKVISGMSGGGVFDTKGNIVGITIGFLPNNIVWEDDGKVLASYKNPSIFMSINYVSDWIEKITEIKIGE